jgi:7-carboxy-7-deazaguanine synthase
MTIDDTYFVNEMFYSLQGEGVRAGTANLFLRFGRCNQRCRVATHGFDCDTEFVSGRDLTTAEIVTELRTLSADCEWVILTGGEPALQVDEWLLGALRSVGLKTAIETNGSVEVPASIDWVTVSPKVAEHAIKQRTANEVKYVRGYGQGIPKTVVLADHLLISPAFDGTEIDPRTLGWCIDLVRDNPEWRLSVQQHKLWAVR